MNNRIENFFNNPNPSQPPIPVFPSAPEIPPVREAAIREVPVSGEESPPPQLSTFQRILFLLSLQLWGYALGSLIGFTMLHLQRSLDEATNVTFTVAWTYMFIASVLFEIRHGRGIWVKVRKTLHRLQAWRQSRRSWF